MFPIGSITGKGSVISVFDTPSKFFCSLIGKLPFPMQELSQGIKTFLRNLVTLPVLGTNFHSLTLALDMGCN